MSLFRYVNIKWLTPLPEQWQPSPAGPDVDAPPRQTAPPGLPYSAAGGTRSRLALASVRAGLRKGFSRLEGLSISLFSSRFGISQLSQNIS